MTSDTFTCFHRLPFDLRREIYMLATPPRVVHVQEHVDMEGSKEEIRTKINWTLSPDLAYFAPNWRQAVPGKSKQRTLESVGVTSSLGGRYQAWQPSASTPEIPMTWLQDNPRVMMQIMRKNHLYSETPIPPLLHTCYEARSVLVRWGYMLAFATRRGGPGTWFHFDRDVLFVTKDRREDLPDDDLLTTSPWRILGQFHSRDLKKVRTLALGDSAPTLFPWKSYPYYDLLAITIQLFPDLRELQIVQWEEEELFKWRNFGKNAAAKHPWYTDQGTDVAGELYSLPVEEIDALFGMLSHHDGHRSDVPAAGVMGEMIRTHKQRTDTKLGFFEYQQNIMEEKLGEESSKLRRASREGEPGLSTFSWKIPRVKAVHIIPPSMATLIKEERQLAWQKLLKLKNNRKSREHSPAELISSRLPALYPWLDEDEEPDTDWHLGPFSEIHQYNYGRDVIYSRAKSWWAENGSIPEPSTEALF
ncbi:hypothetical protein BJY04DRAFT_29050 [Aspergillus karnatakaensis]|uniref:2EXR domain-containing protein n=1 Tax=Aspergillus karnatakaensis TaxID=1810916 RepID=UPI003CCD0CB7